MKEKEQKAHGRVSNEMEKRGFLLEWYAATAQVHKPQLMLYTGGGGGVNINCANYRSSSNNIGADNLCSLLFRPS